MPANGQSNRPSVKAQLKELLRNMLIFVDSASEDERQRLLTSLQNFEGEERRRHPRKTCSMQVTVGIWRLFTEFIKNISCGGVFIETSESFSAGEHITLTFSPPNRNKPLRITGRVVRRTPEGIGVEFTTPPNGELEKIIESL